MIVDTSVLVSTFDKRAARHEEAVACLEDYAGAIYVTQSVVTETAYFCRKLSLASELALIANLIDGVFIPLATAEADWHRIGELVGAYSDLPLSSTDASVVAIAERMGITRIATFDQDFAVVQPLHVERFELVP